MADYERAFDLLRKAKEVGGKLHGDIQLPPPPVPRPPYAISVSPRQPEQERSPIDSNEQVLPSKSYLRKLTFLGITEFKSPLNCTVPNYTITHKLGTGGFATVYRAINDEGKVVAIKLPKFLDETLDMSVLKKFEAEADMWKKLRHKNIVSFYNGGLLPAPYLAVELMEGGTLKDLLKVHSFLVDEAIDVMLQILAGMSYAHKMASVHRDIKPENILFTKEGIPKISDWGIGKFMASEGVSKTVGTKGTIAYGSPEQISKQFGKIDWQTDVFQLGIVFYEMLTGKNPFYDDDALRIMGNITGENPEPPSAVNPKVPPELDRIIMTALQKKKEQRWSSAEIMHYELKKLLEG